MSDIAEVYKEAEQAEETFRDKISTVDETGKRVWVYPKKPKGRFTNYRTVVNYLLLSILFAGPFIKIGGQPLLLLNVIERKFIIFGQIFWPQDFFLFGIGMITTVVFVILFTVVFGRIFCGWVCPQTIFMEGVFRRIEYWIDGDYMAQKKLTNQPWNQEKILKRVAKHSIFVLISALIMHTFMAYMLGVDALWKMIQAGPGANPGGFVAMLLFTGLFYGVFAWMREQVCTTICPYGRLQGVLLDRNSIVVAYDHVRGEERGKFRKNQDRESAGLGDCIDCKQCVHVCPTGIDIRNGTQLECVNCTACIDACDAIMDRINLPRGLIRYASEKNIADGLPFKFTPRIAFYSVVLTLLVGFLVSLLVFRSDFETTILRTPGVLYQEREDGKITNLYQLQIVNKTNYAHNVSLQLIEPEGTIEMVGENINLKEQGIGEGAFFVVIDPSVLNELSSKIKIGVYSGEEQIEVVKTNFLGPAK